MSYCSTRWLMGHFRISSFAAFVLRAGERTVHFSAAAIVQTWVGNNNNRELYRTRSQVLVVMANCDRPLGYPWNPPLAFATLSCLIIIGPDLTRVPKTSRACGGHSCPWRAWVKEPSTAGSKGAQNQCQMYCISVAKVLDTSAMHWKSVPNIGTDHDIFATKNQCRSQCHSRYFSVLNGNDFYWSRHWFSST